MKKIIACFLLVLANFVPSFAQNDRYVHKNLPAHYLETRQMVGEDHIEHIDSLAGYKITVPQYWQIKETPTRNILSGVFSKTHGIENALALKVNLKAEFSDFKEFKDIVIARYEVGDQMKWSQAHQLLKKEKLNVFEKLGDAYYVELQWNGKIYCCCYILVETSTTFLWIDFTATTETYDENFIKFKKIMETIVII